MNLWDQIIQQLELTLQAGPLTFGQVRGAFCGDLLSDVLANAAPGDLWITIHHHRNIVAVASLVNLSGIIISNNRLPDPETVEAAIKEGIPLFTTPLNNFMASGELFKILSDNSII
ncbi:DRTGG domain-containing protein [Desulfotruncus alcoholivorax]|uniref:DRTGG domain-containing protein n=1 Tax=Desulfotruncus alcoholivorax TaxID=265477 RepID=UPI0003F5D224|nr:DRTGG domain-containing protein [Desulfotruncus alcoholivorax]